MDKRSISILRYIARSDKPVSDRELDAQFGNKTKLSVEFLRDSGFIVAANRYLDPNTNREMPTDHGPYVITAAGLAFLEQRPGVLYDKWSTRILAVYAAITSTAAIFLELWLHFL